MILNIGVKKISILTPMFQITLSTKGQNQIIEENRFISARRELKVQMLFNSV